MKYKVEDKVRVRGDLEVGKFYGGIKFLSDMEKNKIFDVLSVSENGECELNDAYKYYYSPEMLRPAEFKIWCETDEEKRAVLEELEKEGYVWCSGDKPTNGKNTHTAPVMLYVENEVIRQNWTKKPFDFTPSEFTGIDFSEKIIITKSKTGATATYGDKTVTAEGEFEDASRQALAEVLCPFKVGDKVRVKGDKETFYTVDSIKARTEVAINDTNIYHGGTWLAESLEPYTEPSYNAKLFCIEGYGRIFKKGYIYKVKDGIFHGGIGVKFDNLEQINNHYCSKFMEVKGGLDE